MSKSDQNIENNKSDENDDILATAKERFRQAEDAEAIIRADALDDLEFRVGNQWDPAILQARKRANRPALTVNKIPQYCQNITNEMRQNKPSIKVYPVDDNADIEIAKILQGMIRNIEYSSNATVAYVNAGEGAVTKSFGYFRITKDYISPNSFDQELQIKSIANHFSVYLDPAAQEVDGSDANWGFVFENVSKYEHKAMYPDSEASQMSDWSSIGDSQNQGWFSNDSTCRVAEYFYKEFKKEKIFNVQVNIDPQAPEYLVLNKKELEDLKLTNVPFEVINERETLKSVIKWCKINGLEILEKTIWDGSYIPIIPVYGARTNVNGRWVLESVFRNAKDSQRILNYYKSNEAEAIALAPKAPFIIAEGQIPKEYENQWKTANTETHAFLPYKPQSIAGLQVPAPQRNHFEPAIQALTQASIQANDDIKATTGIYDASLGARTNENSGIAIQRRMMQSQNANYHFIDNLARSIQHAGRILVEMIPMTYDNARIARIIGEDGTPELVPVNQDFEKGGKQIKYDLSIGKYDVVVDVGPSYDTKRQEAADSMLQMAKIYPPLMEIAGDIILKNLDWPMAQELSERKKNSMDPKILGDKEKQPIPQEVQVMLQQQAEMIDALTKQTNELNDEKKMKNAELESKERIEMAKLAHDANIQAAKIEKELNLVLYNEDIKMIKDRLSLLDMDEPVDETFNETDDNMVVESQQNNEQGQF